MKSYATSLNVCQMIKNEANENDLWKSTMSFGDITGDGGKNRKRPASQQVFTCPHCPYKSNRHFNIQRHERLAHSTKKPEYSCSECGTSYSLEYRLKLHIKAVHQGEGHICHVCNKTFETVTGLKSHIISKHSQKEEKPLPALPSLSLPVFQQAESQVQFEVSFYYFLWVQYIFLL